MSDIFESTLKTLKVRERELELELRKVRQCIEAISSPPKKVHHKNLEIICVVCNKIFLAARKDAKFCSKECSKVGYSRKSVVTTLVQGAQK